MTLRLFTVEPDVAPRTDRVEELPALDWFSRLRAATSHEITAAGGITTLDDVRALTALNIHLALGMAIYTGRLDLAELSAL